ncbi:diaminopimelate decarboxylase [bacterium]|jgi:diaminopimelate decarboxylase|nr:diaminopimelate decarboxylase [bacterium]MBT3795466.1 diaminopimelate decarboxylase [bacterium]MBT4634788.1 diaminopimelate decarboxylase [bacterium]
MLNVIDNKLFVEDVSFEYLAGVHGTPCYIYSKAALVNEFLDYQDAFKGYSKTTICYSVKANSNLSILKIFNSLGSGFDIVSEGELDRIIKIGADPKKVVFSGVAKSDSEIAKAIEFGICFFNVESFDELLAINRISEDLGTKARVSIRVNPDIDPKTHPYISTGLKTSKFGIAIEDSLDAYIEASKMNNIQVVGIDAHIGSQIFDLQPFEDSLARLENLFYKLRDMGINIQFIDIGGGLGIKYKDDDIPPTKADFASKIIKIMKNINCNLVLEPGRSLVGNAGYLITKVVYEKKSNKKNFLIVDAGMNDILRPSLYSAYHKISKSISSSKNKKVYDIVGPICETGDVLSYDVALNDIKLGENLVIHSAGAYGSVMSSNYNSRPKVPEVLVSGKTSYTIKKKETIDQLLQNEVIIDD